MAANTIDSVAVAELDSAANPFGDLEDFLGEDEALPAADEEYLREHPFTGLLIAQAGILSSTPLFVAEEFAFDQVFGNGCHIDSDKRFLASRG